jgi:hypothetical protein
MAGLNNYFRLSARSILWRFSREIIAQPPNSLVHCASTSKNVKLYLTDEHDVIEPCAALRDAPGA